VHFACHGIFSAVNPHLSMLVLSEGQPLLLYNVLYNVRWSHVRVAVLSACDSARIDYRNLPDEAVGLPAGFLQAGVPGVVGALWPVEDEATALLMVRFYRNLLGSDDEGITPMPPAEALRQAQHFVRDTPTFASPLYWAPFVFHGA
jgi:CHAT domain-containing protein